LQSKPNKARRAPGRPRDPSLSRERVLSAATTLLDRDGPDALTMRRLAANLEVSPMALYNHFDGKQDLMRGVAEHLVGQIDFASGHGDWRERIRFCFRRLRSAILAHPGSVRLMEQLEQAPLAVFRPMEVTLAALEEAGLSAGEALKSYFLLTNFTMGQVSYEVRGPFNSLDPTKALASGHLRGAEFEHIEAAASFERWDFDGAFEFGLSVIIAGLERMATRPGR
jgi:TetR/AcrR family transcriptional regulator, tetracycline repressor protein